MNVLDRAILLLGLAVVFFQRRIIDGDGLIRFQSLQHLFEQGHADSSKYSLVGPLFASPLYLLGKLARTPAYWVVSFNFVIFCVALWLLNRLLRGVLSARERFSFLAILIYGSMFPAHLQQFYGEVFSSLLIGIGLAGVALERMSPCGSWALAIVGTANIPASLVGLGLASAEQSRSTKKYAAIVAPVIAAGLVLAENALRRGSPLAVDMPARAGSRRSCLFPVCTASVTRFWRALFLFCSLSARGCFFFAGTSAPAAT